MYSMQNSFILYQWITKKKKNVTRKPLLDINCPLRVDQDTQIRSTAHQHGNSYKTTTCEQYP